MCWGGALRDWLHQAPFYEVLIDGKPMKTNGMNKLQVPSESLAMAIAAEFAVQTDIILPASTPLVRRWSQVLSRPVQVCTLPVVHPFVPRLCAVRAVCIVVGWRLVGPAVALCAVLKSYWPPLDRFVRTVVWLPRHVSHSTT